MRNFPFEQYRNSVIIPFAPHVPSQISDHFRTNPKAYDHKNMI